MRTTRALVNRVEEDRDIDEQEGTGGGVRYSYDVYYSFKPLSSGQFDGHTTLDYNPLEEDSSQTFESEVRKDGSTYYPLHGQSLMVAYDLRNPANNRAQENLPSLFGSIISHGIVLVVLGAFAALGIRFIRSRLNELKESGAAQATVPEKASPDLAISERPSPPTSTDGGNTRLAALLGVPEDQVSDALEKIRKQASELTPKKPEEEIFDPEKRTRLAAILGVSEDHIPDALESLKRKISEAFKKPDSSE